MTAIDISDILKYVGIYLLTEFDEIGPNSLICHLKALPDIKKSI